MVGSTPPEMTRAGQGRARPDRGAWRRWRAVLCVALLAALLPAAAGPAAAQSDPSGVGFATDDDINGTVDMNGAVLIEATGAEIDSPGCYFGSIGGRQAGRMDLHVKDRKSKKIPQSVHKDQDNDGMRDGVLEDVRVDVADVDRVKVNLTAGKVYVFEVRGKDSGGGTLVDPELSGVYVDPDQSVYDEYKNYIDENTYALYEVGGELKKLPLKADGTIDLDALPENAASDESRVAGRYNPPNRLDSDSGQIFGNGIENADLTKTVTVEGLTKTVESLRPSEYVLHEYVLLDDGGNPIPVLFDIGEDGIPIPIPILHDKDGEPDLDENGYPILDLDGDGTNLIHKGSNDYGGRGEAIPWLNRMLWVDHIDYLLRVPYDGDGNPYDGDGNPKGDVHVFGDFPVFVDADGNPVDADDYPISLVFLDADDQPVRAGGAVSLDFLDADDEDADGNPVYDEPVYLVFLDAEGTAVSNGTAVSTDVTVEDVTIRKKFLLDSDPDTNQMTLDDAYDSDDGKGQDAWMLFKPLATGDHFLQIEGSGNWFGSYTVLVYEAKDSTPCEVSLTIEAVDPLVPEGEPAVFLISWTNMPAVPVDLKYTYESLHYFQPSPDMLGTQSTQLTDNGMSSMSISIPTDDDGDIEEGDGSVTIEILPRVGYELGSSASATVVVQDNDGGPDVSIRAVKSSVDEGEVAEFEISAGGTLGDTQTDTFVHILYSDEGDFVASSDAIEIDGMRFAGPGPWDVGLRGTGPWDVSVQTVVDDVIESDGSVTIEIGKKAGSSGYTVGSPRLATVDVHDVDGGPPIIMDTVACPHGKTTVACPHVEPTSDRLPLWHALVYWDLPTGVPEDQVSHWKVEWARGLCDAEQESLRWSNARYTVARLQEIDTLGRREAGVEWLASGDPVHFRVSAKFNDVVEGPYSKPSEKSCLVLEELNPEPGTEVPQATVRFELLTGIHNDETYELEFHVGSLFPIDIVFSQPVDISRADLHRALDVTGGTSTAIPSSAAPSSSRTCSGPSPAGG